MDCNCHPNWFRTLYSDHDDDDDDVLTSAHFPEMSPVVTKYPQVALMRDQLMTVASAARSGPQKYASMVSNVVDIPKPQEAFVGEIDNNRDTPFVPRIRDKPNAVTPLDLTPVRLI